MRIFVIVKDDPMTVLAWTDDRAEAQKMVEFLGIAEHSFHEIERATGFYHREGGRHVCDLRRDGSEVLDAGRGISDPCLA